MPPATRTPRPTHTPRPTKIKGCGSFRTRFIPEIGSYRQVWEPDSDCDGVPDTHDNCPYVPNTDQAESNPGGSYGDACPPENGYRITNSASEVVIYVMDDGSLHFFSPDGHRLGMVVPSGGLTKIDPSLSLRQVVGRTYAVTYTGPDGRTHTTRFDYYLNFGVSDISTVVVSPDVAQMRIGETRQFTAKGYHPSGIELWFMPRWSAIGGSATTDGLYTAGATPGEYTVTACRSYNVCGTAQVTVTP